MDKTGEASNSCGPTGEAEEEDLVARFKVVKDKAVTFQDVLRDSVADQISRDSAPVRAHAPVVEGDLVVGAVFDHVVHFVDVGAESFSAFLSGSVGEDDDVFGHIFYLLLIPRNWLPMSLKGGQKLEIFSTLFSL